VHVIKDRYFARKIYLSHVIAMSNKSLRWIDTMRKIRHLMPSISSY